jgi:uncharacterized protein with ParB-like and HNH nuclease domain
MQVGTLAIQHLFEKDVLYRVPLYQRPYVWNRDEQWQPLWEDLQRLAETLLAGGQPRAHFLGASVQDRPPVPPGQIETRLLIDGQQRLTTIQLFLKAFGDVVRPHGDQRYHQAISKLIRNNHPLSTHIVLNPGSEACSKAMRLTDYPISLTNLDRASSVTGVPR